MNIRSHYIWAAADCWDDPTFQSFDEHPEYLQAQAALIVNLSDKPDDMDYNDVLDQVATLIQQVAPDPDAWLLRQPEFVTLGEQHVYYINVFERGREYGGPEEGGWYYDTGHFMPDLSYSIPAQSVTAEGANMIGRAFAEALNQTSDARGVPHPGETSYRGGRYIVQADTVPGVDFPAERPIYQ